MYDPARDIYTSTDAAASKDDSSAKHHEEADAQTAPADTDTQSSVSKEQQPQTLVDGPGSLNPAVSESLTSPLFVRSVFFESEKKEREREN